MSRSGPRQAKCESCFPDRVGFKEVGRGSIMYICWKKGKGIKEPLFYVGLSLSISAAFYWYLTLLSATWKGKKDLRSHLGIDLRIFQTEGRPVTKCANPSSWRLLRLTCLLGSLPSSNIHTLISKGPVDMGLEVSCGLVAMMACLPLK